MSAPPPQARDLDERVNSRLAALAVPAFFALVTEPLFLLADSAIVGHLGTPQLAGLGVASVVLRGAVGLCVFLAYGTTAAVAREVGAGKPGRALAQGVDGLWLALLVGLMGTVVGVALSGTLVGLFDTSPEVAAEATTYLRLGWLGLAPMLLVLAATGVLRGLHDTRTPLSVAVAANLANIGLNVLLVYGLDLGIAGSAIGTDLAQVGAAAALVLVVVRAARREGAALSPDLPGVRRSARAGGPLIIRTLSLQACLVAMTWAAADLGDTAVATHQLALSVWMFLAFALDALAIAAQAITGTALGAGDLAVTRRVTDRIIRIGLVAGTGTGVLLAATAPLLGPLFTSDPDVVSLLGRVLLVAAVFQPVAGVVFVLDGVLIGAGDGRYLAAGGSVVTLLFVPVVLLLGAWSTTADLLWLWAAFGLVFLGGRCVVLVTRARGDRWMVVGSGAGGGAGPA